MGNIKMNTPVLLMGIFVFSVFIYTSVINILPNNSSNSYYSTENENINAKVESFNFDKGKLIVKTSGTAIQGCIKSTKSMPDTKTPCWIEVDNNSFSTSILKGKTYYVWLMDDAGNIGTINEYKGK